jgi:putative restriction endonuclease
MRGCSHPLRIALAASNPFYETMREVSPRDVIFSFVDTFLAAIGIAQSYCWESPNPHFSSIEKQ